MSVSLDGYVAGVDQRLEEPLGENGLALHQWIFPTRTFCAMTSQGGGEAGLDDDVVRAGFTGIGATVMGRNMFGPVRGPWAGNDWTGWWGETPPFHHPVFVLTHEPRPALELDGTTFHFVTEGVEVALERARTAAGDLDVRVGGGAATVRQCLAAGLIDELQFSVVPVLLARGEPLFERRGESLRGYSCVRVAPSDSIVHYWLAREG